MRKPYSYVKYSYITASLSIQPMHVISNSVSTVPLKGLIEIVPEVGGLFVGRVIEALSDYPELRSVTFKFISYSFPGDNSSASNMRYVLSTFVFAIVSKL